MELGAIKVQNTKHDSSREKTNPFNPAKNAASALALAALLTFAPLAEKALSIPDAEAAQRRGKHSAASAKEKEFREFMKKHENADEVELSCISPFYLSKITVNGKSISARDFYDGNMMAYCDMLIVTLVHKDGSATFNEKTISDRGNGCGFSGKFEQELHKPGFSRGNATCDAARFAMYYILDSAKKSKNIFYGAWAAGALLASAALYGVFSAIKKIRGVRMTKKKEDLEKLGEEYKKKLEPYLDKFWEAKTLEELRALANEEYKLTAEIRKLDKKYHGKLMPHLEALIHELNIRWMASQRKLGGHRWFV